MEEAEACFNSDEYKAAAQFRRQNNVGDNELTIVEAGDLRRPPEFSIQTKESKNDEPRRRADGNPLGRHR